MQPKNLMHIFNFWWNTLKLTCFWFFGYKSHTKRKKLKIFAFPECLYMSWPGTSKKFFRSGDLVIKSVALLRLLVLSLNFPSEAHAKAGQRPALARNERSVREALLQKIDSKKMSHIRTTSKKKYVPYPRFPDFSIIRTTSQKKYAPFPKYFS